MTKILEAEKKILKDLKKKKPASFPSLRHSGMVLRAIWDEVNLQFSRDLRCYRKKISITQLVQKKVKTRISDLDIMTL